MHVREITSGDRAAETGLHAMLGRVSDACCCKAGEFFLASLTCTPWMSGWKLLPFSG